MNSQKRKTIFLIIGVIALSLISYFTYEHFTFIQTDNAQIEAPAILMSAKVSGYITEVKVTEGQKVQKGDVLVKIDSRDYQSFADSAKSELQSLEARMKDAEKNFQRIKSLFSQSVVSAQQYDSTLANYHEIKSKYDAASARLAQAQLNLENTEIKAPSNGIIARKSAEVGQLAAPGAALVGFVSSERRWIMANFKETELTGIKIGNAVEIEIDAIPDSHFKGEVESISSATGATFTLLPPDNATGNFTKVVQRVPVKIKFVNLQQEDFEKIQAGLSATIKVHKK